MTGPVNGLDRGTVKALLAAHGLGADPRYSQNYLCQPDLAWELVVKTGIAEGDRVLEVGPGLGSLTRPVLERIGGNGVLFAREIDSRFRPVLELLADACPALRLSWGDALTLAREETGPVDRVISNLPYNSTTPLLAHLLAAWPEARSMGVMIQSDVWPRVNARPGTDRYGPLAVMVTSFAEPRHIKSVAPGAFEPAPHIGSAFILMDPEGSPSRWQEARQVLTQGKGEQWYRFISRLFRQRRKTVLNNLAAEAGETGPGREESAAILTRAEISPSSRAEQLTPDALARLWRVYVD